MKQTTLDGSNLTELREKYDETIHERLPEAAHNGDGWPIHLDHCFARVVLDNLFEDEWYDHVDGRPAYEHLSKTELKEAITIAERLLENGPAAAEELNDRSLRWRGKLDD